ncbi:hypothetical protein CYMTET_57065 [Cymbomonas tetramitiformis]|uniref:Uncharacterized protein n=1 Tax=Cymbomonas tetramitiformis TaxID=36881 RepID=A0AAE0BA37_9CHLO|nr:hypothetical protein CYMTET_57065 [Cymbomonas tetramitiformis]
MARLCWEWRICKSRVRQKNLTRLLEMNDDAMDWLWSRYRMHDRRPVNCDDVDRHRIEFGTATALAYMDARGIWRHAPLNLQACRRIRHRRMTELFGDNLSIFSLDAEAHFEKCGATTGCSLKFESVVNGWRCVTFAMTVGVRYFAYRSVCGVLRDQRTDEGAKDCCSALLTRCRDEEACDERFAVAGSNFGETPWGTFAEANGLWLVAWTTSELKFNFVWIVIGLYIKLVWFRIHH